MTPHTSKLWNKDNSFAECVVCFIFLLLVIYNQLIIESLTNWQGDNIVLSDWADESTSDSIREHAWRNYYKHDPKKEALLHNLLKKRHKLAQATGRFTYSIDLVLLFRCPDEFTSSLLPLPVMQHTYVLLAIPRVPALAL